MEEIEYQDNERVLFKTRGKPLGMKAKEADLFVTEGHIIIELEEPIELFEGYQEVKTRNISVQKIPTSHIENCHFPADSDPATIMGVGTAQTTTVTLTYRDTSGQSRAMKIDMSMRDAKSLSSEVEAARRNLYQTSGIPLYARCWERFEASVFDFGGLIVLTAIIIFIVGETAELPPDTMALTLPIWLIVSGIYSVILWTRRGQTLGKMVIGIKIIKNDGRQISIGAAILRYVALIGPTIILSIAFFFARLEIENITGSFNWDVLFIPLILSTPLLPLITIILNSENQGLHDKIAGTLVIRVR